MIKNNKSLRILLRIVVAILLSLPVGLTSSGSDKQFYVDMYQGVQSFSDIFEQSTVRLYTWEYGYNFLCYIGNFFNLSDQSFLVFVAFIVNYLYLIVFYKYPIPFFSVLCFCVSPLYSQENNIIRQVIAIAFFLNAISYLKDKRYLLYLLLVIVASLFHKSATYLSVLAIIPLLKLTETKVFKVFCYLLWAISILVYLRVINISFIDFIGQLADSTYENYVNLYNSVGMSDVEWIEFFAMNLLLLISLIKQPKIDIIFFIMLLAVVGLNIRNSMPNLGRFFFYFYSIIPVYISTTIMSEPSDRDLKKLSVFFNVASILYFVVYLFLFISLRGGRPIFV